MFKPFLVPAGNKKYVSDGKALFTKSMKTLVAIDPSLEEYTIPEGVTAIEEYAFYGSAIKSIDIPETVTKIGNNAFEYCRKLKKVSFKGKKGVAKIPENCFRSCYSLQTLSLPSGVRTIERCAFSVSALKTFTMPKSVTVVKDGAFKETSLERMILKRQLTEFGTLWKDLSQKKCEIIAQSKGARKTLRQIRRKRLCSKIKECANNCVDKIKDFVNDNFGNIALLAIVGAIVGVIVGVIFGIKALYGVLPHLLASFLIIIVLCVIDVIALIASKGKDLKGFCLAGCCVPILDVFVILTAIICGSELFWPCDCFFFWKVYLMYFMDSHSWLLDFRSAYSAKS